MGDHLWEKDKTRQINNHIFRFTRLFETGRFHFKFISLTGSKDQWWSKRKEWIIKLNPNKESVWTMLRTTPTWSITPIISIYLFPQIKNRNAV